MKCVNCGANYPSRELRCPYCGTENPRGRLWSRQRRDADDQLSAAKEQQPLLHAQAASRILTRVLLAEGVALVLLLLSVVLLFGGESLFRRVPKEEAAAEMQRLYEQGRFGELYHYMEQHDLMSNENYTYSQAALLFYDYEDFCVKRMQFYDSLAAGEVPDELEAEMLVSSMNEVLVPYMPAYDRLTEENAALHQAWKQDVLQFAEGQLGFSRQQLALLADGWMLSEQEELLAKQIQEAAT